jgi:hypothetical protein
MSIIRTTAQSGNVTYQISGIPSTTTGDTLLFTSGYRSFILTSVIAWNKTIDGTGVNPVSASIGSNDPDYDNIMPITEFTGLTDTLQTVNLIADIGPKTMIAPGTAVYLNITTAASGISLTQEVSICISGFYVEAE